MKHTMKKLTAALLALCCVPVTGLSASAAELQNHFGTSTWDAFEEMERMGQGFLLTGDAELYLRETEQRENYLENDLVLVQPRETWMRIVLREDIDPDWGAEQVVEVLRTYFPDLKYGPGDGTEEGSALNAPQEYWREAPRQIELHLKDTTQRPEHADALESAILLDLAGRHLISEFYGWGETASFNTGFFGGLEGYPLTHQVTVGKPGMYETVPNDWDAVQDYLREKYPGYAVETYRSMDTCVRITGAEDLSHKEQIALACELWEQFDILPQIMMEPEDSSPVTGHNALEKPGDVTLDCEVDIMDVIAVNKALLGSATLCDTAAKNADVNGDGTPDETDSLAILKAVVGITEGLT